jgi:hypothetical protein
MKTKTKAASVSVVVNVGKESKRKRKTTRKRKAAVLAPGQLAPMRAIYDNANERAIHFSNFPAQRVIHENLPTAPVAQQAPVQQWFMNPGTPMLGPPPKVEEYLGSPIPRPNFPEIKREVIIGAPPQEAGLGAERPHSPESLNRPVSPERKVRGGNGGLRTQPKGPREKLSPSPWKK